MGGLLIAITGLLSMMGYFSSQIYTGSGCDPALPGECSAKIFDVKEVFGHIGFVMYIFAANTCCFNLRAEA
jgi:hypothetical protein